MTPRKKYVIVLSAVLIAAAAIFFYAAHVGKNRRFLLLFSGAGMKVPVSEINENFLDSTGLPIDVHFDGSAIIRQYIETYGDADLFLSGDRENIELLEKKGLVREKMFVAWHVPAILVPAGNVKNIRGLDDMAKKGVRLVMSNPRQASLGALVREVLLRHPNGKAILANVVAYGSSTEDDLRLFRDLYPQGKADAMIEWDVMVHVPEGKGLIAIPFEAEYAVKDPLILALLTTSRDPGTAKRFYDHFKREGLHVFSTHGYAIEAGK
jgi:molybdate transport system substrate-binding protein